MANESFGFEPRSFNVGVPAYGGSGGLGGGGILEGLILGALVGNRGGLFGNTGATTDSTAASHPIFDATVLSKLGTIEASIPLGAAATGSAILEQTIALINIANQNNLSQLSASSNVKDAIQTTSAALLVNQMQGTQTVLTAIAGLGSKIDQNLISELQSQLAESRHIGRAKETEVNVSQTVNTVQAQTQSQQQQQQMITALNGIMCSVAHTNQLAQATNQNIIAGNTGAVTTAAQTASPTNVNTR